MKKKFISISRKGQFYIFGAIILSTVIFFTVVNRVVLQESDKNFKKLYDNYILEGYSVINNALFNEVNVSEQFENYTRDYIDYSKSKDTELGILYILIFENDIRIANFLNAPVYYNKQYIVDIRGERVFQKSGNFSVSYENISYSYDYDNIDGVQFKALIEKI